MSTLTANEMGRIKAEIFDNVLSIGATPWIDVRAIYDIIQTNVQSASTAPTTSATAVTSPGPTLLTLGSVADLSTSTRIVLDVDTGREVVTVRAVIGSTVSVICTKQHSGTYPVEIESPLTIVRGILSDLEAIDLQERIAIPQAGLKKVDEIEFFSRNEGGSAHASLTQHRNTLRSRLASACGLAGIMRELMNRASVSGGGTSSYEAY